MTLEASPENTEDLPSDEALARLVKETLDKSGELLTDEDFAQFDEARSSFTVSLVEQYSDLELKKLKAYHALVGSGIDRFPDKVFGLDDKSEERAILSEIQDFIGRIKRDF